jgi:4-hydroxy-2-oxoheptanedioate aldolase
LSNGSPSTAATRRSGQRGGETVCTILIETRSAIDNIEEICEVEGLDCLTIAPFDLSTELGVSGRLDAPELVEAVTMWSG